MRRATLISLISTFAAAALPAQAVTVLQDIEYAQIGSTKLHVDLYLPKDASTRTPCVVWLHHGGWRSGHRRSAQADATDLASRGLAVAAVQYRFSQEAKWPAQIHDCKGAVRWLRKNAATYNLDPDRFAAFGHSSGGHLAAVLGTSGGVVSLEGTVGGNLEQSSRVQYAAAFAAPTDLLEPTSYEPANSFASELIGKSIGEIKQNLSKPEYATWVELARSVDPARYVTSDDPPFFLAHGTTDTIVPPSQSEHLHDALTAAGVTSALVSAASGHNLPAFVWNQRRNVLISKLLSEVSFRAYGKGCNAPTQNELGIGLSGSPRRGQTLGITLSSGPATSPAVLMMCARRVKVTLESLGAPQCAFLVIDPLLLHITATDGDGNAELRMPLPTSLPPGLVFWSQWTAFAPNANQLGWVMSNGARVEIE